MSFSFFDLPGSGFPVRIRIRDRIESGSDTGCDLMFGVAREQTSITIDLDDVAEFDQELAEAIAENTRRYVQVCCLIICCEPGSGRIGIILPDLYPHQGSADRDPYPFKQNSKKFHSAR
jgi:hypothetical protein